MMAHLSVLEPILFLGGVGWGVSADARVVIHSRAEHENAKVGV